MFYVLLECHPREGKRCFPDMFDLPYLMSALHAVELARVKPQWDFGHCGHFGRLPSLGGCIDLGTRVRRGKVNNRIFTLCFKVEIQ